MTTNTAVPSLVSQPEAARLLGVSVETIRRLVKRGTLQPIFLSPGSHPRLRLDDVVALTRREERFEHVADMSDLEKLKQARAALRLIASTQTFTTPLDLNHPTKVKTEAVIDELHARMRFATEMLEVLDA